MIKGVTKSIIEITPRSSCFEKVIVILSSSCGTPDRDEIRRQAELLTARAPEHLKRTRRLSCLKMAVCCASGALASAIFFAILYMFV